VEDERSRAEGDVSLGLGELGRVGAVRAIHPELRGRQADGGERPLEIGRVELAEAIGAERVGQERPDQAAACLGDRPAFAMARKVPLKSPIEICTFTVPASAGAGRLATLSAAPDSTPGRAGLAAALQAAPTASSAVAVATIAGNRAVAECIAMTPHEQRWFGV
jgi:hypothetical protein